jgi:hypothetical protein
MPLLVLEIEALALWPASITGFVGLRWAPGFEFAFTCGCVFQTAIARSDRSGSPRWCQAFCPEPDAGWLGQIAADGSFTALFVFALVSSLVASWPRRP